MDITEEQKEIVKSAWSRGLDYNEYRSWSISIRVEPVEPAKYKKLCNKYYEDMKKFFLNQMKED